MKLTQKEYNTSVFLCRNIYEKNKLPKAIYVDKKLSGFYALTIEIEDNTFIVFKGTDGLFGINDWFANFCMLLGLVPNQFKQAIKFVKDHYSEERQIICCGHSLGGAVAQYCVVHIPHENVRCVTFNPAGIRHILKPKKHKLYENNIINISTHRDILYRLTAILPFNWMKNVGKTIIVQDDESWCGVKSHSNWEVFQQVNIEEI